MKKYITVSIICIIAVGLVTFAQISFARVYNSTFDVGSSATSTISGGLTVDGTTLVVDHSGNRVGIGGVPTFYKLEVRHDGGQNFIQIDSDANQQAGIQLSKDDVARWVLYTGVSSTDLRFYSTADMITIQADGDMGIGTTSPATKLDVYSTATTTATIDSIHATRGGCIKLKDYDGSGYTYIVANNGTLTASTNSCL